MSWDGKTYDKYRIEHTDGTPLKGKKYFVLRLDSDDSVEAARVVAAMRAYKCEPRNCDVGTAEEQIDRFVDYCCGKCDGSNCKHGLYMEDEVYRCALKWAQMPYEARKDDSKNGSEQRKGHSRRP